MAADFPSVYSDSPALVASTGNQFVCSFGFLARYVRVDNLTSGNLFLNVNNAAASTSGFFITSCAATDLNTFQYIEPGATQRAVLMSGVGIVSTSTAAATNVISVLALG